MTIEEKELYNYVTGTEPFASLIKNVNRLSQILSIVRSASDIYAMDFCTNNETCFTQQNKDNVAVEIYKIANDDDEVEEVHSQCEGCKYFYACGDLARYEKCDGYEKE